MTISAVSTIIKKYVGRDIPVWQGESGYGSYFPQKHFLGTWHRGNQKNQAKWLLRRFACDMFLELKLTSFFQCVDLSAKHQTGIGKQTPSLHGILENETYKEKLSYHALKNFCAIFDAETKRANYFAPIDLKPIFKKNQKVSRLADMSTIPYTFERNKYHLVAYLLPEDLQLESEELNEVRLPIKVSGLKKITKPILIDMLDGKVYKIKSFGNLPLRDYPLIATDENALADRIIKN